MTSPEMFDHNPLRFVRPEHHPLTLSPADAAALDSLLARSAGQATDPAVDPARRQRVEAWLAVLDKAPTPLPADDLVARTLAAMQRDPSQLTVTRAIDETPSRTFQLGRRFGEFAAMAVAASLLVAVLIPGISQARQKAQRTVCAANLASMGAGLSNYASANNYQLPTLGRPAGTTEPNWLSRDPAAGVTVAKPGHSNAANLLPLIRDGYADAKALACPGLDTPRVVIDLSRNEIPDGARGYSYVNLFGQTQPTWDRRPTTFVLADRNPLFTRVTAATGQPDPYINSLNHNRRGTNVLAADGSVTWVSTPNIGPGGDNIWTIRMGPDCKTQYTGTETARDPRDIFLSP